MNIYIFNHHQPSTTIHQLSIISTTINHQNPRHFSVFLFSVPRKALPEVEAQALVALALGRREELQRQCRDAQQARREARSMGEQRVERPGKWRKSWKIAIYSEFSH